MALSQDDIQFIKAHMGEWLAEQSLGKPSFVYEIELRERMVRVEEALKHQGELMRQGFEQMEKRFEQMERRFEQMERRFDQSDKRFEDLIKRHDHQFMWLIGFITTIAALIIAAGKWL
ncbi:hypothetical protein [Thiocapsa roseopersicina]|uniref:DUF1640 domain-containing protein n=1 Tax=Thiocapsa roseopersicina TaxID=1058 RepID=A0A1H2SVV9_THIRO|nr:hypothetical protein [Thiocapsa roseopersicina]SDW35813.1 hypothetical protein SAMN05421783_103178 [Thiocapsa roseopersicina]